MGYPSTLLLIAGLACVCIEATELAQSESEKVRLLAVTQPRDEVVTDVVGSPSKVGDGKETNSELYNASPVTTRRQLSFVEKQPYLIAYATIIALFSPLASCYQLVKLNPEVDVPFSKMARLSLSILPSQAILKNLQMNIATPITKHCNPWVAFAMVGVLQGGIYGHSNVHFAHALSIGRKPSFKGVFRGTGFAGVRDLLSQGVPFVFSSVVRKQILDRALPTKSSASVLARIKHWTSVLSTSIFSTYLSQGCHNAQITMQADPQLGYLGAIVEVWSKNGLAALWKGAEARVGLLLIVNILNEVLLKRAWQGVEITKKQETKRKSIAKRESSITGKAAGPKTIVPTKILARRPSLGECPTCVPEAA